MICRTWSSTALRSSAGETTTVLGMPVSSSRPRTSAFTSPSNGAAEPMANLISSAVRSPMAIPYSRLTNVCIAASMSKPPQRIAREATRPPREITAVSEVPPPTSTTMLPIGS